MRKHIIKWASFFAVFVLSVIVSSKLLNKGNADMTQTISSATLPIVYMNVNDIYINPLHGFLEPMEGNYLRGTITPISSSRELNFKAELYDSIISGVGFEVRTMDMQRLIEDTTVTDFKLEGTTLYGNIEIKDLIDEDTEYMLIIKLTKSSGEVIRYYSRVINRAELAISDKMNFAYDFSAKTFDKLAAVELKEYMESNREGDNTSYGYVNIHSSFNQLTWGELKPLVSTTKDFQLLEIDEKTASILLTYQVEILGETHNVSEFFRILKGKDRMYLMEYERKMNQVFDMEKNVIVNGKILHGILNETPKMAESESGAVMCFVQQDQLYSYNPLSGQLTQVFAFADKENNDSRCRYNMHGVKPLLIDEYNNIWFIVYGYMNRGMHEGCMGITMYYYDYTLNTIEEKFYIPYTKSYQILEDEIDSLSYLNSAGDFYLLLDGTVYCIKSGRTSVNIIQDGITESRFVSSTDQSVVAWQTGEAIDDYTEIKLLNLNWTNPSSILAESGTIIIPLGFMDHDLVYGVARLTDLTKDATGRTVTPMYSVRIQDTSGNILKEYKYNNIYTTDVEISDNMITLTRIRRNEETGQYEDIASDQIMNNEVSSNKKNLYTSVVTDETETTYQTVLRKSPSTKSPKLANPKEALFDEDRSIILNNPDKLTRYYVYAKNEISGVYTDASEAVMEAYNNYGVVVDKNCNYIWESENRKASTQISKITVPNAQIEFTMMEGAEGAEISAENFATEEGEEMYINPDDDETFAGQDVYAQDERTQRIYALCLDAMLQGSDVYRETSELIKNTSITSILRENLEDKYVFDLSGCYLDAALYYVSRGYPVMVLCPNKEAVVIVGYDSKNTIIYSPMDGEIKKMGMNDSKAWFEAGGNKYITYVSSDN